MRECYNSPNSSGPDVHCVHSVTIRPCPVFSRNAHTGEAFRLEPHKYSNSFDHSPSAAVRRALEEATQHLPLPRPSGMVLLRSFLNETCSPNCDERPTSSAAAASATLRRRHEQRLLKRHSGYTDGRASFAAYLGLIRARRCLEAQPLLRRRMLSAEVSQRGQWFSGKRRRSAGNRVRLSANDI